MIGMLLQFVLAFLLAFVALNVALRVAAWTGTGIIKTRDGKPYQVKLLHWLPRLVNRVRRTPLFAITVGRTICVAGAECWPLLHAHEWKHVEQDERYWGPENELYYLRALLTGHGYSAEHWAEREAMQFASAHAHEFAHLRAVTTPRTPLVPV